MEGLDGKYADIGLSGISLIILLAFVVSFVAYYFLRKRIERKVLLAALCLFLMGFSIALFTILQNHFISGVDSPYYVYQVRYLLEHGTTSEFAPPVVFYTMAGFSVFVGDVTLGVKIAQAFFPTLMGLTAFLLVKYLIKNNFATLGVTLIVTLFGAGLAGTVGAIKNMAGMALAPLFYLFFLKFVNGEGRKWTMKTLKIGGRKLGLTSSTSLVISVVLFFVLMATHFLTAGFVFISVVAYVAFYMGYRRKIPWREFKFFGLLGVLISFALLSSTIRQHIIGNANTFAESYPIPGGLLPFTTQTGDFPMLAFIPFIALTLPAAWFILRQRDRRAQLFVAALLAALLCSQPWIITPNFCFRFAFMIFLSIPALLGISILVARRFHPKAASGILGVGIVFASVMFVGMTTGLAQVGPSGAISEEQWNSLAGLREQLPENCVVYPISHELIPDDSHWQLLLLDREVDYLQGWDEPPLTIENLAERLAYRQQERHTTCLALVPAEYFENRNLGELNLELIASNDTYGALKAKENSGPDGFSSSEFSDDQPQEDQQWHEEERPQPTNEIRFNPNPLFAFILLPIELVQGLYGTWAYGIVKLLVAIPLSIGIIGFLIGLVPIVVRKFKGIWQKPIRRKKRYTST